MTILFHWFRNSDTRVHVKSSSSTTSDWTSIEDILKGTLKTIVEDIGRVRWRLTLIEKVVGCNIQEIRSWLNVVNKCPYHSSFLTVAWKNFLIFVWCTRSISRRKILSLLGMQSHLSIFGYGESSTCEHYYLLEYQVDIARTLPCGNLDQAKWSWLSFIRTEWLVLEFTQRISTWEKERKKGI